MSELCRADLLSTRERWTEKDPFGDEVKESTSFSGKSEHCLETTSVYVLT